MDKETSNIKFTIPKVSNVEDFYSSIVQFLESQGISVSEKRVYSISFTHKSRNITETVGEKSESNNELVCAIFESGELFYTCTPSRGIVGGEPMMTSHVEKVVYFQD